MRAIKNDGLSVLVQCKKLDVSLWLDVSIDTQYKDVVVDWNKYIFHLNDPQDVKIRDIQDDVNNFDDFSSVAIQYLEYKGLIYQDSEGKWFETPAKEN